MADSGQHAAVQKAVEQHRANGGRTHHGEATIAIGARRLVTEVWALVTRGVIDARSPAADAALDLRDSIDPSWDPAAPSEPRQSGPPVIAVNVHPDYDEPWPESSS